jgi:long-chain fatty acid transport protein
MRIARIICCCLVLALAFSPDLFAIGPGNIGNEVLSARGEGQAFVGVAGQNDDPMVGYLNPAALTNLKGTNLTLGGTWENLHPKYEDSSGNITKGRSNDAGVPNFGITQSLLDGKLGTGLTVSSPYGMDTHWAADSPMRYVATNSVLHMIDISPAVGYQVTSQWSIGAAADYFNLFDATLEKNVNNTELNYALSQGRSQASLSDGDAKLSGTAANWGFHTGVMYQPNDKNAFGLTYHNKVVLNVNGSISLTGLSGYAAGLFGGSNFTTSAYTTLVIPQNIQMGYAYKPTDKLTIEADTAWYDWYSQQDLNIRTPAVTDTTQAQILAASSQQMNYRDCWNFATGANYKWTDKLQVRGGIWYEPWVQPEINWNPSLIDLTRYGISVGAGYAFTSNISVDLAYTAVFTHNRSIGTDNVFVAADEVPAGTYKNFMNLVGLNINYKYGSK